MCFLVVSWDLIILVSIESFHWFPTHLLIIHAGIFDRSKPLPTGGELEQADGTAWMAFFCVVMLDISLELALHDPVYEDMASKFFEHFVLIVDAMNKIGDCEGQGLWNEEDGFYYDCLRCVHFVNCFHSPSFSHRIDGKSKPMKVRSMVGLIPLYACLVLEDEVIQKLPGFRKRLQWFLKNRQDLSTQVCKALVLVTYIDVWCR